MKSWQDLSPRELDCIMLLSQGYSSSEAAKLLHIALSTFRKHLAAIRRKVGVDSTALAVLGYTRHTSQQCDQNNLSRELELEPSLIDFAERLKSCYVPAQLLSVVHDEVIRHGFDELALGLVADPSGHVSDAGFVLGSSDNLRAVQELYAVSDLNLVDDPVARHITTGAGAALMQHAWIERCPPDLLVQAKNIIEELRSVGDSRLVGVSLRDSTTGIAYGGGYIPSLDLWRDLERGATQPLDTLMAITRLFGNICASQVIWAIQFNYLVVRKRH